MSVWNFIRNIFGDYSLSKGTINYQDDAGNINLVWRNDENKRNIWDGCCFDTFSTFTDPFENTMHIESQVNSMLNSLFSRFDNIEEDMFINQFSIKPPQIEEGKSLREQLFKSNTDVFEHTTAKQDIDLDGKIDPHTFSNIWNNLNKSTPQVQELRPHIGVKFTVQEYVQRPDGTIEKRQIIRDHEGNEKTIVTRQSGGNIHTVITEKDKNGIETKRESFSDVN